MKASHILKLRQLTQKPQFKFKGIQKGVDQFEAYPLYDLILPGHPRHKSTLVGETLAKLGLVKLFIPLCFLILVGCNRRGSVPPLTESIVSFKTVEKPDFGLPNIKEEHFGYLDSSGLVSITSTGKVFAFIHDVGTWFKIPVNREVNAPYVMINGSYVQYRNFQGARPYYIAICALE